MHGVTDDMLSNRGVVVIIASHAADIRVRRRRDKRAAKRFFRKLLQEQGTAPRRLVTDKLRSYSAAHRETMPEVIHCTEQYANNRAEVSHQRTRQQERQMRKFHSAGQAQKFLSVHGLVANLFGLACRLMRVTNNRRFRSRAFRRWQQAMSVQ